MKSAPVNQLKKDLGQSSNEDLINLCLRLAKFKKENKELLTYLLYEANDEEAFIQGIKEESRHLFNEINTSSYYYIKKSVRKILRNIKKYVRYSQKNETEIELLLFFCRELKKMEPPFEANVTLTNLFARQIQAIKRLIGKMHEDLQFDYNLELDQVINQK